MKIALYENPVTIIPESFFRGLFPVSDKYEESMYYLIPVLLRFR